MNTTTMKAISLDVSAATDKQLVEFYNEHSGSNKLIDAFSSREEAETRVSELITAHNELAGGASKGKKASKKKAPAKKFKPKGGVTTNAGKGAKAKPAAKKAPAKKGEKKAAKASTGEGRLYAGKFIFRVAKENPRRAGTHGHRSWELIRDGMSYDSYIEAGGRNRDLRHDVILGRLRVADKPKK